jgi:CSLREA domain-containing protein
MAMKKIIRLSFPFIAACLMLGVLIYLVGPSSRAAAAPSPSNPEGTMLVTTLEDELNSDGDCSLREAITAANYNAAVDACGAGDSVITDTITFDVAGTIVVTSQLSVTAGGPLVIDGGDVITTSGGGTTRVWWAEQYAKLSLFHLTISDGFAEGDFGGGLNSNGKTIIVNSTFIRNEGWGGSGLFNSGGNMAIINSNFVNNIATSVGGGIYNLGIMMINNSTFSGNSASIGGAINSQYSSLIIHNSTISGNSATNDGGAIHTSTGSLTITNSSISGNSANYGGGIDNSEGTTILINSIVANSPAGGDCVNYLGMIVDGGHNISSDDTCGFDPANGSMPNTDPLLGPLQDNGGSTWTHALLSNSPAIDAGDNDQSPLEDQRGMPRPLDGDGDGDEISDIGSYEAGGSFLSVTTLEDELNIDGDCSLREALEAANSNLPVDACGTGTLVFDLIKINLTGSIPLTDQLSVTAGGRLLVDAGGVITISGNGESRIWWVEADSELTLQHLAIVDGSLGLGGGAGLTNNDGNVTIANSIFSGNEAWSCGGINNMGTLTIINSAFTGNYAHGQPGIGGAICNNGTLTLIESTLSHNSADHSAGGIFNAGILTIMNSTFSGNDAFNSGGGIDNMGTLAITNSTFSGNRSGSGGGIYDRGTLTITSSTISSNSASSGGGINAIYGSAILTNTIVANSKSGGDCSSAIIDGGHNLDSDNTCGLDPSNGSLPGTDPLLGPLRDNSGPTLTHALLSGSPAIDAGDDAICPSIDQRGIPRPRDGNRDGEAMCDIGSYEYEPGLLMVNTLADELNSDGDCSLREAVLAANTNQFVDACGSGGITSDTILFDVSGTITVTGQLSVTAGGPLVIDGGDVITTSGGGTTRVWWVETFGELTLQHISVINGMSAMGSGIVNMGMVNIVNSTFAGNNTFSFEGGDSFGGGIANWGDLIISNSTFTDNNSHYACFFYCYWNYHSMGGGVANLGTLSIMNSTFSGNSATSNYSDYSGGGIYNTGTLNIANSTFSGNSAFTGGGIYSNAGSVLLANTIIANSPSGGDCSGQITDGGHNLDSDGTCGFDPANGSLPNTDPLLGPLQDNGGSTYTHGLLEGSPAIDAGDDAQCLPTDQRGRLSPQDGDLDGYKICDIGSFEVFIFIVTTLEDELNNDNDCSLREAIEAANVNLTVDACGEGVSSTDSIAFMVTGTVLLADQLSVDAGGPLEIRGGDVITISGGNNVRVFGMGSGSVVTLQDLYIIGGSAANGGGIFNQGDLTINRSRLSSNQAGNSGGGINNMNSLLLNYSQVNGNSASSGGGIINSGTLTINNCQIFANIGGGIVNEQGSMTIMNSVVSDNERNGESGGGIQNSGTLMIYNSTIQYNAAEYSGGGIHNEWLSPATIISSTISMNISNGEGGGVSNNGVLTITSTTFLENEANGNGGGITNSGTITITSSTISGNGTIGDGGGISNNGTSTITNSTISENDTAGNGGGILNNGAFTITSTTISGNGTSGDGGGISNYGTLTITNSTISGNVTTGNGGGISNDGESTITSSTISGNGTTGNGGGIYNNNMATLYNTIVANNSINDCSGAVTDGGHNLSSDDTCSLDPGNGSLPDTDPLLSPLQDNGGPTWTHALLEGSPAIDAGENERCSTNDQRWMPRFLDGNGDLIIICDIGPYERDGEFIIVTTLDDEINQDRYCSLREAVTSAVDNVSTGACQAGKGDADDNIVFIVSGTVTLNDQLPDVIAGETLIIDGRHGITITPQYLVRFFYITGGRLSLQNIILSAGAGPAGGGIYNDAGDLTLNTVTMIGNHAEDWWGGKGGAIYNNNGNVSITNCTFLNNYVTGGDTNSLTCGGGVYNSGGTVNVHESIFTGNYALSWGASEGATYGGGICNDDGGSIVVTNCQFTNNSTEGRVGGGAGLANVDGTVTIADSVYSSNNVTGDESGHGGAVSNSGQMTVTGCTFDTNAVYGWLSSTGGAVDNGGILVISNSTFHNNFSTGDMTGSRGGGLSHYANEGPLTVYNCTFSENSAELGGEIFIGHDTSAMFYNTIVANSLSGGDCLRENGIFIDGGHNISSDDTCGFDPANGSLPNTDPLLGPLQDNGGPTWTHALLPDSPAIDAGDDAQCPSTDQRGIIRPQDGDGDGVSICDIGSYELEGPWITPTLITITGPSVGIVGQSYPFTANVEPISTTLPLNYAWQISDMPPFTSTGGLTDTVNIAWGTPGSQAITVTASNPSGSASATHIITITDVPISGLVASNDSPTLLGEPTTLSATIQAGTNVIFTWDFGDNEAGSGQAITHTYLSVGIYTATVTATNSANSLTDTTLVTIFTPGYHFYLPLVIKSAQTPLAPDSSLLEGGVLVAVVVLEVVSRLKRRG